jgi:hypothetical protein
MQQREKKRVDLWNESEYGRFGGKSYLTGRCWYDMLTLVSEQWKQRYD